jgi:hypothetical protein
MNGLLKTELFILLSDTSQEVTNAEMQSAYGDFIEHVKAVSLENDYTKIHRDLNITRIELSTLESILQYEQGGEMHLNLLICKRHWH